MKYSLLILLTLVFSHGSIGQTNFGFREGSIVRKSGDTIHCLIELAIIYDTRVKYKINETDKPGSIKIKDIKSMKVLPRSFENIQSGKKEKLMVTVVEGKINLYNDIEIEDRVISNSPTMTGTVSRNINHYTIKRGNDYIHIERKKFKETVQQLFSDCSTVINKVANDIYKYDDLKMLITEYNSCQN